IKSLQGDKVVLRPLKPADASHIRRWMNDPQVCQWLARPPKMTKREAERWINTLTKGQTEIGFGIVLPKERTLIGIVVLYGINLHHRTGSTGTVVGEKEYWRRGYATEAK